MPNTSFYLHSLTKLHLSPQGWWGSSICNPWNSSLMRMDTSPCCCWGLGAGFMLIALGASAVYKPSAQVSVLQWQWREVVTCSPALPDLCSSIRLGSIAPCKHTFLVTGSVSKACVCSAGLCSPEFQYSASRIVAAETFSSEPRFPFHLFSPGISSICACTSLALIIKAFSNSEAVGRS